jgi:very-short-patch-repair endonuclease
MHGLEQTRGFDLRIAELAERQHGVVSRQQLLGFGVTEEAVEVRLEAGRLHRLHRGVYAVGHRVLSRERRWMAAVLFCGTDAVLSHRSAAALWSIRPSSSAAIDVTVPTKSRSRGNVRRHFGVLPADEVTVERGIPVTTVPRTIFDLAAASSVDVVEYALRESEYRRLYDRLSLRDLLGRYPGRRGTRSVRECLARRATAPPGRVRSRLEEHFLPFLRRYRLPLPQLNAWIPLEPKGCEVDCLWPARKQIVELDGFEGHGTRGAFREDRARDRRLRVAGYGVARIAWAQLDDEAGEIAADLRSLLEG